MASLDDVQDALVNLISAALYPNGTSQPSALVAGFRVYGGNPTAAVLNNDIRAGYAQQNGQFALISLAENWAHVTVNPRSGIGRVAKPYVFGPPASGVAPAQTLTVAVSGSTITLGGAVAAGLGVAAQVGPAIQGAAAVQGDTLATLAGKLAAVLTGAGQTCSAAGPVVTVPAGLSVVANTFVLQPSAYETSRQIQGFETVIYCAGRPLRSAAGRLIKAALDNAKRVTLPDGFQALIKASPPIEIDDDRVQQALLFERKIYHSVEYPTTVLQQVATLAIVQANVADQNDVAIATVTEA